MVAASLFLPAGGYAYEVHNEVLDRDAYGDEAGCGAGGADDFPTAEGWGMACASSDPNCWGWGWGWGCAYRDEKRYITDYDPEVDPELDGYVSGACEAVVTAYGDVETSDYFAQAVGYGYGAGYTCYAYVEISEPDDADIDVDWFGEHKDMSYNGATIYYGQWAFG
jgi:hypothetical protein